ncbi:hypothetical protein L873DRAFT_1841385 [Choiromyces venosus 120613-1]|uniref:Cora-domain-containing protein n=1 Tax=Choiromyces venosus 120613-1 TaxID=1336337 RepID=A0A3N4JXG4_9PEZI|nr:hypothetical protein L873DRAFT_1841385 [Choiromyces venosus 120613-1]
MSDPSDDDVAPHPSSTPRLTSPRLVSQLLQPPHVSRIPPQRSGENLSVWDKIDDEQPRFYDEQDCLHSSLSLLSKKLKEKKRGENHVVIFNYSLKLNYLGWVDSSIERSSSENEGQFDTEDDRFCVVSKDALIESTEFGQITNLDARELDSTVSRGTRLGIIDFPQCYDTRNDDFLNMMVKELGLASEDTPTFEKLHSDRVQALPGRGGFRTGISLRVPFQNPSNNGFTLFVSFPYFGKSSSGITLGTGRESVHLLDFKRLGVHVHDDRPGEFVEEAEAGDILVHQARYMVFDNHTMATFRSKEDSAKYQVPLHRFQERIGAFRALIHMIANRTSTDLESWVFLELQAGLCELVNSFSLFSQRNLALIFEVYQEKEIDQAISNAETHHDNQALPKKYVDVQILLISLNRLSAQLFAAISVVERQIAILHDLDSVFSTCYRTETRNDEVNSQRKQNPFHRNTAPIPIFLDNREQIWPNTLDTIKEVVQERKSFIKKIKELIENMDIRRKILSVFLKYDQAKAAPSERTAQEAADAMKRTEETIKETQATLVQQAQTLSGFTIVTTAFLPLSFCASYFGMNNITEFNDQHPISIRDFWLTTGPVCAGVITLTVLIIIWKRPEMANIKKDVKRKLGISDSKKKKNSGDLEMQNLLSRQGTISTA